MLIKIAICEDSTLHQQEVMHLLQEWKEQSGSDILTHVYTDSDKLSSAIDENFAAYDAYLLDIEMKTSMEGLEIARRIRLKHEDIPIIFITSHAELTLEGYDVQAMHFLGKPIPKDRFFNTLNRLVKDLESRASSFYTCIIDGATRRIPVHNIRYFVSDKSDSHYTLINGDSSLRFRSKLVDVVKAYPDDFIICHQSYVVNINHSRSLLGSTLTLSDGTELPVSKTHLQEVRRRFKKFISINP